MLKHLPMSFEQRRAAVAAVAASLALAISGSLASDAAFSQGAGEGSGAHQLAMNCLDCVGEPESDPGEPGGASPYR